MLAADEKTLSVLDPRLMKLLRSPSTGEALRLDGGDLLSPAGERWRIDPSGVPLFAESALTAEAAAQQAHYARIMEIYLENLQYPHTREYGASLDRALLDVAGNAPLGTVAEICSGQADAFALLGDRIDLGVGVDISLPMIQVARRRHFASKFFFVQADATRVPLAAGVFDHVVMLGGIHHVPDRAALFGQVHRLLRPGGRFIWREPVSDFFLWRWLRAAVYRLSPALDHETERPLLYTETAPVLREAGLRLASWRTYGFAGFCLLMNSDVLVVNRLLRFVPGIGAIARGLARMDALCLQAPGMQRSGTMVIGLAVKDGR